MFILRDLLLPLQQKFSNTKQGQKRKVWFAYTLLAVVVPFTSSMTSNLLRALQTLLSSCGGLSPRSAWPVVKTTVFQMSSLSVGGLARRGC